MAVTRVKNLKRKKSYSIYTNLKTVRTANPLHNISTSCRQVLHCIFFMIRVCAHFLYTAGRFFLLLLYIYLFCACIKSRRRKYLELCLFFNHLFMKCTSLFCLFSCICISSLNFYWVWIAMCTCMKKKRQIAQWLQPHSVSWKFQVTEITVMQPTSVKISIQTFPTTQQRWSSVRQHNIYSATDNVSDGQFSIKDRYDSLI